MSVTEKVSAPTPEAMHELGIRLGSVLAAGDLVILTGPLGAGKTTLTRGIGEGLGVRGPVQSPTFVIARTHPSLVGAAPLVHVDAYRLADASEVEDLDLDFDGSVVVAEWGAGLVDARDSWVEIVIERPMGGELMQGGESVQNGGSAPGADDSEHEVEDDGDEPVEPRTITLIGNGPRWVNGVLS